VTTSTTGRTPDGGGWPDTEAEALALLSQLEAEAPDGVTSDRRNDVVKSIRSIGTYEQTAGELTWGARIAWRNAVDCLGRPYWRILTVRDERKADDPDDLFDTCIEHLRVATNGGHVRVVLTATAPASPGRPSWRLLNEQLVQYAGYRTADGFTGDRRNERLTQLAMSLGWSGAGTAFDVLPLVLHREGERPRWRSLPADAVLEVPIVHPDLPWFADVGLRWYANPAICNQELRLGGLRYPVAPFSGWYTCTEVGGRNLSDPDRYDMLPVIASRMGLDTRTGRTLWRDRALVELVRAVLHSYDRAGVTIVDHHFAAHAFVRHEDKERAAGRDVQARWRSLVPPTAASTVPTFAREYSDEVRLPNFFRHPTSQGH
jgi:nitric-oxide synthase